MAAKTFLVSLLRGKCPHCREGDMFTFPLKRLSKFNVMNNTCPHCGVRLEPEPGFYQGAMYVGYAFTIVAIVIISLLLYYVAGNPPSWVYMTTVIGVMILIAPINYRYSRIVFLYLFGGLKYDPRLSE